MEFIFKFVFLNCQFPYYFSDIRNCFKQIGDDPLAHAVVLSGAGKHFTTGMDIVNRSMLLNVFLGL